MKIGDLVKTRPHVNYVVSKIKATRTARIKSFDTGIHNVVLLDRALHGITLWHISDIIKVKENK